MNGCSFEAVQVGRAYPVSLPVMLTSEVGA
jgi:hypothetical protein